MASQNSNQTSNSAISIVDQQERVGAPPQKQHYPAKHHKPMQSFRSKGPNANDGRRPHHLASHKQLQSHKKASDSVSQCSLLEVESSRMGGKMTINRSNSKGSRGSLKNNSVKRTVRKYSTQKNSCQQTP